MRPWLLAIILCQILPGAASADSFILSRGAEILVLSDPTDARNIQRFSDFESGPTMYLPAGTLAVQIEDEQLQSPNRNFRLLLTETGIWGLYVPNHLHFYDHNWFNEIGAWVEEMSGRPGSGCPRYGPEEQIVLIFPFVETDAQITVNGQRSSVTLSPGEVYFNLSYDPTGDTITGYMPLAFEQRCYEIAISRSDVNVTAVPEEGFWCSDNMDFRDSCLFSTLQKIRSDYFRNTRILSNVERHHCAVAESISYTQARVDELIASIESSIGASAEMADVSLGAKIQSTSILRTIIEENKQFPPEFEILRNFYVIADGTDVEVLESWTECPRNGENIKPLTGDERPVFHYYASTHPRKTFDLPFANAVGLQVQNTTGHLVVTSPRQMKIVRDNLVEQHQLDNDQIHFLLSRIFLWQD